MKQTTHHRSHGVKTLTLALSLLLCLAFCASAMAEPGTIFPWLTYTLDVALVSTDPEVVDVQNAPTDGALVLIKLVPTHGTILTEDIQAHYSDIRFRDGDGDEHTTDSLRYRGVAFDKDTGLFSSNPQQDAFEILFYLKGKDESAIAGAKLVVPTEVEGERIIVPLDKAPHDAATQSAGDGSGDESAEDSALSFVIGGVRYTISALEDEPKFQLPNRMDGKEGHVVAFSYPGHGSDAEAANKLLYSGARLRQPNGDLVRAYSNSNNIGNPYELYFGLSDDVLLADCVFTITGDDGEAEIPLSSVGDGSANIANEPQATPVVTATPEPTEEPTPEPTEEPEAKNTADTSDTATTQPATFAATAEGSEEERKIADALMQCAEGVTDEWQLAIYRAGLRELQSETEDGKTVYTFLLRSFDPALKDLGKYSDDNQQDYWADALANAKGYTLEASLTSEDGEFTAKSLKALQGVVKKAASASQKAFKDKQILSAVAYELFYDSFGSKVKKAEDIVMPSDAYIQWAIRHLEVVNRLSAQQWTSFFYGQVKQVLDVSGGPFAMKLNCTCIDISELMEKAKADALDKLKYMDYDNRWAQDQLEYEFLLALADNAITMKKKGKDAFTVTLNVDGEPFYSEVYTRRLAAYGYEEALSELENDVLSLPEYPAKEFPSAGWMSGSKNGTQVKIKAPKDSVAYYVQLRNYHNDEIAVAGFVQPGKTCTLRVPKGDYYFVLASGTTWYGEKYLFGEETNISKTGLFEVESSKYYHTVTLKVTEGGNMPLYGADEDDLR